VIRIYIYICIQHFGLINLPRFFVMINFYIKYINRYVHGVYIMLYAIKSIIWFFSKFWNCCNRYQHFWPIVRYNLLPIHALWEKFKFWQQIWNAFDAITWIIYFKTPVVDLYKNTTIFGSIDRISVESLPSTLLWKPCPSIDTNDMRVSNRKITMSPCAPNLSVYT